MEYFGYNVDVTTSSRLSGYVGRNHNMIWTCPNTGPQQVMELGARVKVLSGSSTIRCAIYDNYGNFILQGSAAITITNTSLQWISHTSFVDVNGNPLLAPKLTGGNNYYMCVTGSAGDAYSGYNPGSVNDENYRAVNYTGGYPSTLGTGWAGIAYKLCIRCGVVPFIPVVMDYHRRMRNA